MSETTSLTLSLAPSLLPRCLQHRAPVHYELVDSRQRRLTATLAGYRLRPGTEYRLRVTTQDGRSAGWSLQLIPPPRFIEWPTGDSADGPARVLAVRTRHYGKEHLWLLFQDPAAELVVRIHFDDGRQPYEFRIPVVLVDRWKYLPLIFVSLVAGIPLSLTWGWKLGLWAGAVALVGAVSLLTDLRRGYVRARRSIATAREGLGST